jgi:putative hydrolase of the HAD superfamily
LPLALSRIRQSRRAIGDRSGRNPPIQVVVTSNFDSRLPAILDGLGLAGLFDSLFVSAQLGVAKPQPAIFDAIARRFRLTDPRQILHVGDRFFESLMIFLI